MKKNKIIIAGALLCLAAGAVAQAANHRLDNPLGHTGPIDNWATEWAESLGTVVSDPGFEAGSPNPAWDEFSQNFGTPLCTELTCGLGGGTGPNSGSWWAWFGGIGAVEEGSVSQTVDVPAGGAATLSFFLETPACNGDNADFMEALVGGTQVFIVRGDDANCNVTGYRQISVDISSFSGQTVELEFHSIIQGAGGEVTNFFIDDVEITAGGGGSPVFSVTGSCPGTVTLELTGGTPNGIGGLIFSNATGSDVLGAGPCAGTPSGLSSPALFTIVPLDASGGFSLTRTAPAGVCGTFLQVVDGSCSLSNVQQVN